MQKFRGLLVILALGVFLVIGVWSGFKLHQFFGGNPTLYNTSAVVKQVQTLAQLVTVKYVVEKIVVYEDVKWYYGGDNRVMLIAHGIVKAGVDLQKLKPEDIEFEAKAKTVTIRLPTPQIMDCYLDEKQTQIVERTTGLLRAFDKDLEQTARLIAVEDIRRGARSAGILKDAEERAREQLEKFFQQLGYEVKFLTR